MIRAMTPTLETRIRWTAVPTKCMCGACLYVRTPQSTAEEKEDKKFVRWYTRRVWLRTWCAMYRYNLISFGNDTREGIRGRQFSIAIGTGKTGPYPPRADNDIRVGQDAPRRPGANVLGTVYTPVVVQHSGTT